MTTSGSGAALAVVFVAAAGLAGCEQMGGAPPPEKPAAAPVVEKPKARPADGTEVYKIALADSPARGGSAPKVTLVAFSEFQCPFCARVTATLEELAKSYGDDLRIVFKHRPLPFHDRAQAAALAAEAAGEQGKFWEMHDKMFAQKPLDPATLEKYAGELGLDVGRWKAALAGSRAKNRLDADMKLADQFGVSGTPTFFINGRMLMGAQPVEKFRALIDEEMKKADQKLAAGVARGSLYDETIKTGLDKREAGAGGRLAGKGGAGCPGGPGCAGGAAQQPEVDNKVYKVDLGVAPVRGPRDAAVTIALFSDFQCPFCSKVQGTLAALDKEYPGKVRVVWKNFPLGFHENARGAALAAHAAGEQGRFWEMHDKLMQNQKALGPENLEKYAQELGLDLVRWKAAMASPAAAQVVDGDMKQAESLGISGTPTMLINGRKVVGAQPLEALKPIVEEELVKVGSKRRPGG
jgi:protein-disulfide isomerase